MSSHFDTAHHFTARWEGGLTDHPADPGGITNHGVSLRWLLHLERQFPAEARQLDFSGDGRVNAADIRACTAAQAAALMRRHFWEPLRCDELPLPLAVALYDAAVNTGAGQAARLFQASCNVVGEAHLEVFAPLREDGVCGPLTVRRARELGDCGLAFYTARHAVRARQNFYTRLTRQRTDLQVFLKGWTNRCNALLDYLAQMEREV